MALSPLASSRGVHNVAIVRRMSMETYMVRIYTGPLSQDMEFVSVEAEKVTTADDVVKVASSKLKLPGHKNYELAEVFSTAGQLCKERRLGESETPVRIQLLWPKIVNAEYDRSHGGYTGWRFYIRRKNLDNAQRTSSWMEYTDPSPVDNFLTAFLKQPTSNKEYSDLCNLPDLNERTLLENIKSRFQNSNIYTYVGSILIAVNPFKFFPIYNPKYVKMYQNKRLGDLPPHIFAIADAAFYTMLRTRRNQCIVISGESGSGKTESTNLLLHHLTALSHKGLHGSGVEQTILGAGPVLEAFGNAKTVHNNNSSRFGKFIQVNYKENGMVHGAIVEKYLLEKSRIVSQASNERNYHVFYYLLEGADSLEREKLHLGTPEEYFYLKQSDCYTLDEVDEANEFSRLKQSMEMVGFSQVTQKRIFGVLSAVLHLGNVTFKKKGDQHHDESVTITNPETISLISRLLMVKEKTLTEALTQKKTIAGDETVVMTHRMEHAVATRDAMAKCLYGALFDWIVLKVNQALLAKRHNSEHQEGEGETSDYVRHTGNSIGVLDIFGFEDFRWNSFEQFCINYANEHLQYYFNQHIFKFEQEEYKKEGIQWKNIEFIDNTGCLELFSKKGNGLFSLLDEECNFPGASNDTLLTKFHHHHAKGNVYYEAPQRREMAFTVVHYAGKVKYQVKDFREKNSDQIRTDIVANLKSSSLSFVRELMGVDPVAVLRWTIVKTLIKSVFAFLKAGKTYRKRGGPDQTMVQRRKQSNPGNYLDIPDLGSSHFLSPACSPTRGKSPRSSLHDPRTSPSNHDDVDPYDSHDDEVFIINKRHSGSLHSPVDPYLSEDEVRVMRKATRVMMKNKSFKPKSRPQTMFSDIKTLKAIANRTIYIGGKVNSKQKPPSVGAQFQWSLSRLMSTLNQANPFFIRCIKSNAEKLPCRFDDILVLRQLRYTGMLATVRIRQSGYNYRLTFEEFVQLYKILLPKGLQSEKEDVASFLESKNMNSDNYQIGKTKVFLRESEKLHIDECLHCAIMKRVITLQRWVKTKVERKNYINLRDNTIIIQKHIRRFLARRRLEMVREAVLCVQRCYRGYRERKEFRRMRTSAITIQAHVKGHLCRKRFRAREGELRRERALREASRHTEDMHSSTSDEGVLIKDNSADELDIRGLPYMRRDSEESSGILDDSESDTLSEAAKSPGDSVGSPPPTPTSLGPAPEIHVESLHTSRDNYLTQAGKNRVSDLTRHFQTPERDQQSFQDETDGRGSAGHIFVRRGSAARKRPPKMSPAPLAKQESFSDLDQPDGRAAADSPTNASPSKLSPDKYKNISDALKKPPGNKDTIATAASAEDIHRSPFKRVMNLMVPQESLRETKSFPSSTLPHLHAPHSEHLKRKMSFSSTLLRRTKSSIKLLRDMKTGTAGRKKKDSTAEDSDDDNTEKHMHHVGGVSVLPPHPNQPLSPRSPPQDSGATLFSDDEKGSGRVIQKKRRTRKPDKTEKDKENSRPVEKGHWKVENMTKWQYPDEFVIKEAWELQELDKFIKEKINSLEKAVFGKKESQFDMIFMKCLRCYQTELKATLSIFLDREKERENNVNIKYRDLFANFEVTMVGTCHEENVDREFPVTLCINAFRGYLDEFRNSVKSKASKAKKKHNRPNKRDKYKKDVQLEHQGHKFGQTQFAIPTFCELCSTLIWITDKGYVCQVCKYACHKKCASKTLSTCKGALEPTNQRIVGTKVFSVPLLGLVGPEDKIPMFLDHLILLIETHGLYTEGIYRKSGSAPKIKALKVQLDSGITDIDIENIPVHVLTSTLKTFFRELPEPLLTFDLYDAFIQASEIQDEKEAIQGLFSLVEKLPKVNHDVFERLIFHLARVAQHEANNKMSVNGLAIIFAPCLLRTNKVVQAQDMLLQVHRQQLCVEKILHEQLRKLRTTLKDINTLESAELTATERLSVVRASMNKGVKPTSKCKKKDVATTPSVSEDPEALEEQERVINSHIMSLRKEKDDLTSSLPTFEYRHSSDDEMLSTDDIESVYDATEDEEVTFETPAKAHSKLRHLTKHRANLPNRRPPSTHHSNGHHGDDLHSEPFKGHDIQHSKSDLDLEQSKGQELKSHTFKIQPPILSCSPELRDNLYRDSKNMKRVTEQDDMSTDGLNKRKRNSDCSLEQKFYASKSSEDIENERPSVYRSLDEEHMNMKTSLGQEVSAESRQVDALLDPGNKIGSKSGQFNKRPFLSPHAPSMLSKRLEEMSNPSPSSHPAEWDTDNGEREREVKPNVIPADSVMLAKAKSRQLFGTSPQRIAKLTKPSKLPLDTNNERKCKRGRPVTPKKAEMPFMTKSKGAANPLSGSKPLSLSSPSSSMESSELSLKDCSDSDEEIMV